MMGMYMTWKQPLFSKIVSDGKAKIDESGGSNVPQRRVSSPVISPAKLFNASRNHRNSPRLITVERTELPLIDSTARLGALG